jgi:hypothetical protein
MAVPRPLLLALLGVMLVGVAFVATRNAQQRVNEPAAAQQPAATPPQVKRALKPQQALRAEQAAKAKQEAKAAHASKPAVKAAAKPQAKPAPKPKPKPAKARALSRTPLLAARAIAHRKVTVLFFYQAGSADDEGTAKAVAALKHHRGVAVFSDRVDHVARYAPVLGTATVKRGPTVVIVDRHRHAHLIEGFIDTETLAQEVADTRR